MKSALPHMLWALVIGLIAGVAFSRSCSRGSSMPALEIKRDTVVIRDTIRPPIPEPQLRVLVRYDTVRLPPKTVERPATIETTVTLDSLTIVDNIAVLPVTSSEYKTPDYRAVLEGYNARLVSMELYPQTTLINTTATKYQRPTWAITIGPGVGYGPKGVQPYIGVTFGFVLWSR